MIAFWLTDVLAIYGAALSSTTALVGYLTWRRTIQTRVEVKARPMMLHQADEPDQPIVIIELINHSQHEVAVTHVSFQRGDDDRHLFIPRPFPLTEPLPIVIPPRRAKTVWVEERTLWEYRDELLRAKVSTDDGHTFRSSPVILAGAPGGAG